MRSILQATLLLFLTFVLATFTEGSSNVPIKIRSGEERASGSSWLRRAQQLRELKGRRHFLLDGFGERSLYDWALSLGDLQSRQDGMNVSQECGRQLGEFTSNLNKALTNMSSAMEIFDEKNWSIRVIDSYGKIPSGILVGGFGFLGDYSECVGIRNDDWQGKYCYISNGFLNPLGSSASSLTFLLGICLTETCNQNDVNNIVSSLIQRLPESLVNATGLAEATVNCQVNANVDSVAVSGIVIFSLIILLVSVATIYDIYKQHYTAPKNKIHVEPEIRLENLQNGEENKQPSDSKPKEKAKESDSKFLQVLEVFSVYTNAKKLFDMSPKGGEQIECLNAIRVITISWVVLCHSYSFMLAVLDNKAETLSLVKRFTFNVVSNGFFSVDTFFLLSGFLTCHLFLKEMQKPNAKVTPGFILKYYFHRYWRLTPVYMLCIYLSVSVTPLFSYGPFSYGPDGFEPNRCRKSWWTNALYINNLGLYPEEICFGEAWYLANDMQYHWLSPLILVPLSLKNKKLHAVGIFAGLAFIFQSFITTALVLHAKPESAIGLFGPEGFHYFLKIYTKPWSRIQPFIVGIFLAYILSHRSSSKGKFKFHWAVSVLLWLVSLLLMALVLFGRHDADARALSINTHIIYECFSRLAWALGLAGVIFLCYTSNGYFINDMLSWSIWRPLARLNYAVFLIHPTVLLVFMLNLKRFFYLSDINMIWLFTANVTLSFVAGSVVSLLLETPFIRLERFIFKR